MGQDMEDVCVCVCVVWDSHDHYYVLRRRDGESRGHGFYSSWQGLPGVALSGIYFRFGRDRQRGQHDIFPAFVDKSQSFRYPNGIVNIKHTNTEFHYVLRTIKSQGCNSMALGPHFHRNLDVGDIPFMDQLVRYSLAIVNVFRISLTELASWGEGKNAKSG